MKMPDILWPPQASGIPSAFDLPFRPVVLRWHWAIGAGMAFCILGWGGAESVAAAEPAPAERAAAGSPATFIEWMARFAADSLDTPRLLSILQNGEGNLGLKPNEERAVLDKTMVFLRGRLEPGDPLEDSLMAVASDSERDPGVREYAVQHLGRWHGKTAHPSKVEDALWALTENPVVSTSAILQLHHLGLTSRGGQADAFTPILLRAMARPDLRDADRMTLVLVAAERGLPQGLPYAREWAQSASERLLLLASLTAIGTLGGPQDVAFLDQLETPGEWRDVRKTVETTRTRLNAKASQGVEP